jgi:hypothetical protein
MVVILQKNAEFTTIAEGIMVAPKGECLKV